MRFTLTVFLLLVAGVVHSNPLVKSRPIVSRLVRVHTLPTLSELVTSTSGLSLEPGETRVSREILKNASNLVGERAQALCDRLHPALEEAVLHRKFCVEGRQKSLNRKNKTLVDILAKQMDVRLDIFRLKHGNASVGLVPKNGNALAPETEEEDGQSTWGPFHIKALNLKLPSDPSACTVAHELAHFQKGHLFYGVLGDVLDHSEFNKDRNGYVINAVKSLVGMSNGQRLRRACEHEADMIAMSQGLDFAEERCSSLAPDVVWQLLIYSMVPFAFASLSDGNAYTAIPYLAYLYYDFRRDSSHSFIFSRIWNAVKMRNAMRQENQLQKIAEIEERKMQLAAGKD